MKKTNKWSIVPTEDLADYCAQKQIEIAELTKMQDDAKKELFARMMEDKQEEVVTPFGRFYQTYRTTYVFPEDVVALKNQLTQAEETAKAEGRAKEKKATFYKFGAVKLEL